MTLFMIVSTSPMESKTFIKDKFYVKFEESFILSGLKMYNDNK